MSTERDYSSKKTNWSPTSLIIGILIGFTLLFIYNRLTSDDGRLTNISEIIAAVPESEKDNASEYVLKAVQFTARLQSEIDNFDKETSISKDLQDEITKRYKVEKEDSNLSRLSLTTAVGCPDDTIQGINFELIPIIESLLNGQNKTRIEDLTLANYGIYVAFGKYPEVKPSDFQISDDDYNRDYKLKRTAIINYTKKESTTTGGVTAVVHNYLNAGGSTDATKRLADNLGMVCPRHCPR